MKTFINIDKLELSFNLNDETRNRLIEGVEFQNEFYSIYKASSAELNTITYKIILSIGAEFGTITFGTKHFNKNKLYLLVNNQMLYTSYLPLIYDIINVLNLDFSTINLFDIAIDFDKNIINKFYKLLPNEEYEFIILNKSRGIDDEIGELLHLTTGTRRNIKKNKSFYINNKEGGLTLHAYNKLKEINDNDNKKDYITDLTKTKNLYRLEIRTQHHILKDTLNKLGYTDDYLLQVIIDRDNTELFYIYVNLLERLIRIKYKNNIYSLLDFLL